MSLPLGPLARYFRSVLFFRVRNPVSDLLNELCSKRTLSISTELRRAYNCQNRNGTLLVS